MKKVFWLLCFPLAGLSQFSQAACTLPSSTANLGSVTSFAVNSSTSTTSVAVNVNCGSGSTASLLSNNTINLQLASASNASGTRAILKRSGDTGSDNIPLQLCTNSTCYTEMTIGGNTVPFTSSQLVNLVGLTGGLNFTLPLWLRTVPGQVVAAGTYTATLNILVTWRICTGVAVLGICLSGSDQNGSGTVPLAVTMIITPDCTTITAPNINFGSAALVSMFKSISQTVSVLCTKGSSYTIGISNGSHAVGNVRNMANGSQLLSYEIYKGSSSNRWGSSGTERQSSANAATVTSDGLTRTFPYTAQILTSQNTPAAGNYSDSAVIDIAF